MDRPSAHVCEGARNPLIATDSRGGGFAGEAAACEKALVRKGIRHRSVARAHAGQLRMGHAQRAARPRCRNPYIATDQPTKPTACRGVSHPSVSVRAEDVNTAHGRIVLQRKGNRLSAAREARQWHSSEHAVDAKWDGLTTQKSGRHGSVHQPSASQQCACWPKGMTSGCRAPAPWSWQQMARGWWSPHEHHHGSQAGRCCELQWDTAHGHAIVRRDTGAVGLHHTSAHDAQRHDDDQPHREAGLTSDGLAVPAARTRAGLGRRVMVKTWRVLTLLSVRATFFSHRIGCEAPVPFLSRSLPWTARGSAGDSGVWPDQQRARCHYAPARQRMGGCRRCERCARAHAGHPSRCAAVSAEQWIRCSSGGTGVHAGAAHRSLHGPFCSAAALSPLAGLSARAGLDPTHTGRER